MENCKDLDKLFGDNCIIISIDNDIGLAKHFDKSHYLLDDEQLIYKDAYGKRSSNIKYIFAYHEGAFHCLYKKPMVRPEIQTGDFIRNDMGDIGVVADDFVYYQNGGFDRLSSIMKSNSYITEIRRPNTCYGFEFYSKMPLIWPEKIKNNA